MAANRSRTPALAIWASLVLVACAQATGPGEEDLSAIGTGGAVGAPGCQPESGCSSCTGCIAQCICQTGDKVGCVEQCGPPGGPPPPPNPPPPGGGGGGGAPSSGGGAPSSGGWNSGGGGKPSGGGGVPGGGGGGGSGGTVTGGGGSVGGTGGSPTGNCTYPPGPYGTSVGKIVDPNLSWQGYVEGAATATTISIQDYFDCDGKRGINALFVSQAALWCGACQSEAAELNGHMAGGWTAKGIDVLVLVIEDKMGNPAQLKHAEAWKNTYKANGWSAAADPKFSFKGPGSNGLPLGVIIDPRTMKIIDKSEGYDPTNTTLVQLAAKNATK